MAITRTAWTDDSGAGTDGTIINNSEKTTLYNQIDDATDHPRCMVENNGTQSIAAGAFAVVTFDTEDYDGFGMHSTGSNTGRITIPSGKDGFYQMTGSATFPANATGVRAGMFRKNGVTNIGPQINVQNGGAAEGVMVIVHAYANLAAADYVEFMVFQNSSSSLSIGSGTEEQRSRCVVARLAKSSS